MTRRPSFLVGQLLLLLSLCLTASAQSFFNAQGLGEIGRSADARAAALGATAALGWHNPAWQIDLPRTRATASLLASGVLGQERNHSRFVGTVRPAGFYAAVPLPLGARVGLGLDETFNQDFDIWTESLPDNPYRYRVVSRGGIYALKAGLAWSFFKSACVGLEYSRLLGAAREDWRLEASGGAYLSVDTVEINYAAHSLKLGVAADFAGFGFGAWFSPALDYRVETVRRVHGVIGDSTVQHRLGLPVTAAIGLRYALTDRLDASTGAEYRPWSGITVDNRTDEQWRDAWRLGGGLEYALDTLYPIRLGYSHQNGYHSFTWAERTTNPLVEHRLHLGAGLPVRGFGSLDLAVELARRDNGILVEYAGRLLVSLAYQEAWQRRTRRWGY